MKSYFYPTVPGWFEPLLVEWKTSGKRTLSFPFLWYKPTTLPDDKNAPFWMYLYYTVSKTEDKSLQSIVNFRVRVISYGDSIIEGVHVHARQVSASEAKIWFECDLVEEIKNKNGGYLHDSDFKHTIKNISLLQTIRNSIAPVERITPMVTVQSTWHCLND